MPAKTVLIADDDQALTKILAMRCKELGLEVVTCPSGFKAYEAIVKQPPDLLVLDVTMPGVDGLCLYEELAKETSLAPIPAIFLTGRSDTATVEKCKALGAHYVWKGLDTWSDLKTAICKLLDLCPSGPQAESAAAAGTAAPPESDSVPPSSPRVLLVDDDPQLSKALKIRLQAYGVEVLRAFSGMQGYWTALKELPDVIITDYTMPDGYGNYLLGKLKEHSLTKDIPVIVLTGRTIGGNKDFALERSLLSLGATAFLTKPLDFDALLSELRRHIAIGEPPNAKLRESEYSASRLALSGAKASARSGIVLVCRLSSPTTLRTTSI